MNLPLGQLAAYTVIPAKAGIQNQRQAGFRIPSEAGSSTSAE
jgi:hypothetical protein